MTDEALVKIAVEARKKAYVPFSNFKVGAALLATNGEVFSGCNIENASFTPTVCAERTAFFKAISEGVMEFKAIAIVGGIDDGTEIDQFAYPCGVCRQVMQEFCRPQEFKIIVAKNEKEYKKFNFNELFPFGFGKNNLK